MDSKKELIFKKENIGLGKRKQSIARVFLLPGDGKIIINKTSGNKYLQYNDNYLNTVWSPLEKLNLEKQFDIVALVQGGGLTGQAQAIQLGVARLLCTMDKENRSILKPFGFLTRDSRIKERKKYGLRKARKAPQYSKR
jgi:small subunit ribosomal protein S9|uniref:Small ribosomal subunit protein uS9c n=2 Tax=Phaeodactylum tricornutum TaxID=2850 RepID=RR9_PHATC|nr:ribosomal protein S9 [Phaeodactylum tricornutum]A0T0K2.1 RecName: Full=Small ribosomal subunit protein uS9c; AltName: Full=30S ribosomal protein S9, chloroplastic [Phaeodactylum tricornutum CCAP 1055/1]ABK20700.1 30S ribosomal protein S9 [Phaeodactylum tricornutum]QHR85654.1 30S ribosomal protein S9 [Phaeodactylum tricornutum]